MTTYTECYFIGSLSKILELYFSGISQRTISLTVGSSRHTIREVTSRADRKGVTELTADMSDTWL